MDLDNLYGLYLENPLISTDSRQIEKGCIFFALSGDHFNGNRFAKDALDQGASYAVVDEPSAVIHRNCILVDDTLRALQGLAGKHRENINATVIGITGSNGKTTTKELVGKVLASTYNTVVTKGNLNNHIGVPLTILSIGKNTEYAVVEMGANHQGEIAGLCRIARPHAGVITNIGNAHLEGFGGFEGVVKAKSELFDFIRQHNGTVFVNGNDELLCRLSEGMNVIYYGNHEESICTVNKVNSNPLLDIYWQSSGENNRLQTMLFGDYNIDNILAAICIGITYQISNDRINSSIASYSSENNRSQIIQTEKNTLILDAYNANPSSMSAALKNFSRIEAKSKMVILGDMMELGSYSIDAHRDIINLALELNFKRVFFIGESFIRAAGPNEIPCFLNVDEAYQWLRENPVSDMTILLKGSRRMALEKLHKLF